MENKLKDNVGSENYKYICNSQFKNVETVET